MAAALACLLALVDILPAGSDDPALRCPRKRGHSSSPHGSAHRRRGMLAIVLDGYDRSPGQMPSSSKSPPS